MKTTLVNLKGGAKLLFNRQTEVNGISVVFSFNAGAINDPIDKLGVAHFCEHVMYSFPNAKMTRQQRFDFAHKFQYSNAFTSSRDMRFIVRTIENKLEQAFDFMTESFSTINYSQEEFEVEQKIIRDEISTRKKLNSDLAYRIYNTEILDNEKTKNLIGSPAGTLETFEKITLQDIKDFINTYLTLNNLTIAVVGNTTLNKVKKLVKKYVETRLKTSNTECYVLRNPEISSPRYHFRKAVEKDKAVLNIIYPLKKIPFNYEICREAYVSDLTSAVFYELTYNYFRINKNLCYSCGASICKGDDWLTHQFNIPCSEENLPKIIDLYEDYMMSLPTELPKDLFDKHRERKLGNFNFDFTSLDRISNSCIYNYEEKRKLYNSKLKKQNRKICESITYKECNEMYKTLFKTNPHITIVSNDEKYKDFKYESFKVTKK